MKYSTTSLQAGLSAVELLITLFIAAVFMFAGFQLYAQVANDADDTDDASRVAKTLQKLLQEDMADFKSSNPTGCPLSSPSVANSSQSVTGVGSVTTTITRKCPIPPAPALTKLYQVTVQGDYTDNGAVRTLKYSTYAN